MVTEITGHEIQLDNGEYTRIANAILDVLSKVRFTAAEFRAVHFLLRKTYGFQRKEDAISLSQWAEGTDCERPNVLHTLEGLIAKNVIYRKPGSGQVFIYGFNKYIEQWSAVLFERETARAKHLKRPTVIPPDNSCTGIQQAVIPPDNCYLGVQQTVIPPDNKTVIPPDNNKRKKETLKDNARAAPPKTKAPPKERDPNLDHPAVIAYREICHLTANEVQRQIIAQAVTDCQKWRAVLTEWMASGWKPSNVPGMLDRYQANGNTNRSNGHGHQQATGSIASEANRAANESRPPANRTPRARPRGDGGGTGVPDVQG